ncbi:MAG TPA: hypothetical protein ENN03_07970 [bacterium]|nr:hypothetical protein [bacterium]
MPIRKTILLLLICMPFTVFCQTDFNPPYPRTYYFSFGNPPAAFLSKFDMVNCKTPVNDIKAVAPHIIVTTSRDWNVWELVHEKAPEEWYVRDSQGKIVQSGYGKLMNISEYCEPSIAYGGMKYNEYLIQATIEQTLSNPLYDGFFCQGVWDHPYGTSDVDLDRNGVNDWQEHGIDWLMREWLKGVNKVVGAVYNRFKTENKILQLNSGRFHAFEWYRSNGLNLEHIGPYTNWGYGLGMLMRWMQKAPEPHALTIMAKSTSKNNFSDMRYLLGYSLMGDAFYEFTDQGSGEHLYKHYYDEFDLNLGYPHEKARKLRNGLWVRFFDEGAVIVNPMGSPQTVTRNQLETLKGYDGPYYRFQGGQDPEFNDGSLFLEVRLRGQSGGQKGTRGDAIILLKKPSTVIADIIVDDHKINTSPASLPASFEGRWEPIKIGGKNFRMIHDPHLGMHDAFFAQPARNSRAVYTPSIGVTGYYEVFEWHGYIGRNEEQVTEPNRVRVILHHAEGEEHLFIDQSVRPGRWNSLGIYKFISGNSGQLILHSDAQTGMVQADAFMWSWRGN